MLTREIKFRFWNTKLNRMEDSYWDDMGGMSLELVFDPKSNGGRIPMQYTGLKDKNGTEIYEGDILLSKSWGINTNSKRKTHIVKWGKCGWVASGYNGFVEVNPSLDVKSDFEVIGNIYENK